MLRILLIYCTFLFISANAFAEIYRSIDEDGNVIFTDRSGQGKDERIIILPKSITIKNSTDAPRRERIEGLGRINKTEGAAKPYTQFAIISPGNDEPIRDNTGNVELKLALSPSLQIKFGHRIQIELDGKMQKMRWRMDSMLLTNLDRGTHNLRAFIVDKTGKKLKTSQSVTFHLQKFSRLFKKP